MTYSSRGLPLIGQVTPAPIRSSQGRLSAAACARHSPTEVADGASSVTTMPSTQREHTSIAIVRYGRPTGSRYCSSTTITSTGVWSAWTCCSSSVISGGTPPAALSVRAASLPSLADVAFTGSSWAMRRSTVPRDGTRTPRALHSRVISRQTEATVRRCRVRYRVRRTSRTMASTSSGSRPPPRPPLEVPGSRSDTRPSPALHRLTSTYT